MEQRQLRYKGLIRTVLIICLLTGGIYALSLVVIPNSVSSSGEILSESVVTLRAPVQGELQLQSEDITRGAQLHQGTLFAFIKNKQNTLARDTYLRDLKTHEEYALSQYQRTRHMLESLTRWIGQYKETSTTTSKQISTELAIAELELTTITDGTSAAQAAIEQARDDQALIDERTLKLTNDYNDTLLLSDKKVIAEQRLKEAKTALELARIEQGKTKMKLVELDSLLDQRSSALAIQRRKVTLKQMDLQRAQEDEARAKNMSVLLKGLYLDQLGQGDNLTEHLREILKVVLRLSSLDFHHGETDQFGALLSEHSALCIESLNSLQLIHNNIEQAEELIEQGRVTIPRDARLLSTAGEVGSHVLAGDIIARLIPQNARIQFSALIPEEHFHDVMEKTLSITVRFQSGLKLEGNVETMVRAPQVKNVREGLESTQYVDIRFGLLVTDELPLGMSGIATFHFSEPSNFFAY